MRVLVAACVLLALAAPARASGDVGVVVTGDRELSPAVENHLETWLRDHGHVLVSAPLSAKAIDSVTNCLLVGDDACAARVVDSRGRANSVVFARVSRTGKSITLDAYWFVQGRLPVGEHRVCDDCTSDAWHGIADLMMSALAGASAVEMGRLAIDSKPGGLEVMLDHVRIGVTPLERDLPTGRHEITLVHGGRRVGEREVTITRGATAHVSITAHDLEGPSRLPGGLLLAGGLVAAGGSVACFYLGSLTGPDQKYLYDYGTPLGFGLATVGAGATLVGALLLVQSGHHSAPVVSLGPNGGYVGWITGF